MWLQGASFFGDSITGKSQTTIDAVERLQELIEAGVPPDVKFVISASEMNKVRRFYKRLSKLTKIEVYDLVDTTRDGWETQVMGSVAKRARELDLRFGPEALERFVLSVADTRQLDSELEKLSLFVGRDREVTVEDVRGIVAATHAGAIFAIGDALASRNLPLTWELIEQQLRRGESAIAILLAAIVPRVPESASDPGFAGEAAPANPRQQYRAFEAALNHCRRRKRAPAPQERRRHQLLRDPPDGPALREVFAGGTQGIAARVPGREPAAGFHPDRSPGDPEPVGDPHLGAVRQPPGGVNATNPFFHETVIDTISYRRFGRAGGGIVWSGRGW